MCLTRTSPKAPESVGEGFKVFHIVRDPFDEDKIGLTGVYHRGPNIDLAGWNKTNVMKKVNESYYAGWHIFKTEAAADRMLADVYLRPYRVKLRVRYRGAHTQGFQWPEATTPDSVVAEEFQIIEGQNLVWERIRFV